MSNQYPRERRSSARPPDTTKKRFVDEQAEHEGNQPYWLSQRRSSEAAMAAFRAAGCTEGVSKAESTSARVTIARPRDIPNPSNGGW